VSRPGWDSYFLGVARAVAVRGDCVRSQVGAIAVTSEHRIIATGYNGTSPGSVMSCHEGHCPRVAESPEPYSSYANCIAIHAEINCLRFVFNHYGEPSLTMYVTRKPCEDCQSAIKIYTGVVVRVVWPEGELVP
jgi:dCMP deaminase